MSPCPLGPFWGQWGPKKWPARRGGKAHNSLVFEIDVGAALQLRVELVVFQDLGPVPNAVPSHTFLQGLDLGGGPRPSYRHIRLVDKLSAAGLGFAGIRSTPGSLVQRCSTGMLKGGWSS